MIHQNISLIEESPAQHIPFFHILSDEQKQNFLSQTNIVDYSKRDTIVKQNSKITHIPFIINGLVKVSREMRKGKNIILRIAKPGSFLGLSSANGSDIYEYSISALEPSVIGFVDATFFQNLVAENGNFGLEVVKHIGHDNIFYITRLSSLLYKQLPGRVADIILYFSEEIYQKNTFSIPLTRQELAELAGTTKESLIRTLSEFKHDKIIEMNRNYFTINSISVIKTLSRLG